MAEIVILGAGKFGSRAALRLSGSHKNHITVVDEDQDRCKKSAGPRIDTVCRESIDYLHDCLRQKVMPDWIVPAVPVHVAYEWMKKALPAGWEIAPHPVPDEVARMLPNPMAGTDGQLYSSYADFICPEDCPEPAEICTFTGKARKGTLYRTLAQVTFKNYRSVVVQSRQMAPGMGGYRPRALMEVRRQVLSGDAPVLLSSACKCHGVTHAFHLVSVHRGHL